MRNEATQHEILAVLAQTIPARSYLEVGVRDGATLWAVVEATSGLDVLKTIVACDTWGETKGGSGRGSHEHIARMLRSIGWRHEAVYLDGCSQELLPMFARERQGWRADLVHIDGDHGEEPAYHDLRNGWCLCERVMVVHDLKSETVQRAWGRFLDEKQNEIKAAMVYVGGHHTAVAERKR